MHIERPSDLLSPFVKGYWGIENRMPLGTEHVQRIVPSGLTELIFYLGDLPQSLNPKKNLHEHTLLSGQQKEFYDLRISGHLSLFSIIFQPHGLAEFFDIPAGEIFNLNVPLKYIVKEEAGKLESELAGAYSFEDQIRIAEVFLSNRIRQTRRKYDLDRIRHSIRIINQSRGIVDIETLASEACLSRKQFERIFHAIVGSTPKQFLRTIRFQHAIHEKGMQMETKLTELTYRCGYFDQSHMTSDFKKLAGMTPKEYFADCEPYSDYFQNTFP